MNYNPAILYAFCLFLSLGYVIINKQMKTLKWLNKFHVIISTSVFWFIALAGLFGWF